MKLTTIHKFTGFIAAIALSGIVLASGAPEWWHGHGHGGGGGAAVGKPGDPGKVRRTVTVDMSDNMRFTPSTITVKRGETIRFVVRNSGKMKHEMVLGTEGQLRELYYTRLQTPEKEYASSNGITLEAGKSGEIIWQFSKLGTVSFACLVPGHYDSGMRGTVTVKRNRVPP
ncbi:cupredoxin family protein [Cupriavidus necator]|uniref:cupredoxin domain-containing protein n=1 Tax=Cupriavidus necator TaxID=106590 RepID=UPI0039C1BCCA